MEVVSTLHNEDLTKNRTIIIVTSTMIESFKFQGNSIFYRFSYDYSSPCQSKVTYVCIYINEIGITSLKTTSATRLYKDLDILDIWKL